MALRLATRRSISTPSAVTLRSSVYAKSTIKRHDSVVYRTFNQTVDQRLVDLQVVHRNYRPPSRKSG